MTVPYLNKTRRIAYARYVSSQHHESASEVAALQRRLEAGELEIACSGVLVAPWALELHEPEVNAILRTAGGLYYFAYLEHKPE